MVYVFYYKRNFNNIRKMISLEKKNCFITGATGGIGQELALELYKEKCNLYITGTGYEKTYRLSDKLGNCPFSYADFTKEDQIFALVNKIKVIYGHIDILVNCAGIFNDTFDRMFSINVKASYIFIRQFQDEMMKRKWGRIVNIGSSSAYMGIAKHALYSATKHALLGLSRSFYKELKEYNIRVYYISPAGTKTKMGKENPTQDYDTLLDPKEVAKFIVYTIKYDDRLIIDELRLNRFIP